MVSSCVIYCRHSPRPSVAEANSCETQEAQCRSHARLQGWRVKATFKDKGVSGKTWPRPGFDKAVSVLEAGDVLLAYSPDRIARNIFVDERATNIVERLGCTVAFVVGGTNGGNGAPANAHTNCMRRIMAVLAQYQLELNAENTSRSMRTLQAAGRKMGSRPPFGTMIDPHDPKALIEDPEELAARAEMIRLHKEGVSLKGIARALDNHPRFGVVCRGLGWSRTTIRKQLELAEAEEE